MGPGFKWSEIILLYETKMRKNTTGILARPPKKLYKYTARPPAYEMYIQITNLCPAAGVYTLYSPRLHIKIGPVYSQMKENAFSKF